MSAYVLANLRFLRRHFGSSNGEGNEHINCESGNHLAHAPVSYTVRYCSYVTVKQRVHILDCVD